ncbi:BAR-domain-containing protein [Backusella circina FSU 941]|nr:BAR-domain-containing protein [Backusella circina FSU 941]
MIKNLGKLKQWAGEKLGEAKSTLQTDEFLELEKETINRRKGYEDLVDAVKAIEDHLSKMKSSSHDLKGVPFGILGTSLSNYGKKYPENSALGIALIDLGTLETDLGKLQLNLSQEVGDGYLKTLSNGLEEYKRYDHLKRKLESRRLDYDAKLNRLGKAKKEKPELEQEMQASRIKYQETEHDLFDQMARMQLFEREHRDGLYALIEAQYNYHNQAIKKLEVIRSNWGKKGTFSDPYRSASQSDLYDSPTGVISSSYKSEEEDTLFSQRPSFNTRQSFDSSFYDDGQTTPKDDDDNDNDDDDNYTYRKARYDFHARNDDEVGFKAGDIIQVIDEIDKGWWVGEAHSKRGIFPVNYTEPYQQQEQDGKTKRKSETIPVLPVTPPPQSIPVVVSSGIPKAKTTIDQKKKLSLENSSNNNKSGVNQTSSQMGAHDPKITTSSSTNLACSECDCHGLENNPPKHGFC